MEILFPMYVFQNQTNFDVVIERLWDNNRDEFVKWCCLLRHKEPHWCDRILDIMQVCILNLKSYIFCKKQNIFL